jgi:hypothetical protein
LVRRQLVEQCEHGTRRVVTFGANGGRRSGAFLSLGVFVFEMGHTLILSKAVQNPVSANGEKPGCQVILDPFRLLLAKAQECILHRVPRAVFIAREG